MQTEEPGLPKLLPRPLTSKDLQKIIEHLESIISQCTDITKTKSFAAWVIDHDIYWIFSIFFGESVRTLKPEERMNGYTTAEDSTERVRDQFLIGP
jgi:hypothetical protein